MKSTGMVRRVDELGRIVLPIEIRRNLDIAEKDQLEIYVEGDKIILKSHKESCALCGNAEGLSQFKGKSICAECTDEIKKAI